jgi:hypothetical protein
MATEDEYSQLPDENLSEIQLTNIYLSLSQETNVDYDLIDITQKINSIIESIYSKDFLLKETELIQSDQILINKSFVELIKETNKINYKQFGIIFLVFCEYFNLDGNKTFNLLHGKIKEIIEKSTQQIIGKDIYQKVKNKKDAADVNSGITIISIFDL